MDRTVPAEAMVFGVAHPRRECLSVADAHARVQSPWEIHIYEMAQKKDYNTG